VSGDLLAPAGQEPPFGDVLVDQLMNHLDVIFCRRTNDRLASCAHQRRTRSLARGRGLA
jgi:hypothetical protein